MEWLVDKLELGDAGYRSTFFWVVPTKAAALEQARQILDNDTTGRVAINIRPHGAEQGNSDETEH